ncbi:MAG: carbon-nitrogen hydrolase family protein [Planctomycetaceae bacterium]
MTSFAIAAAQVASYCEEIELNIETHVSAAQVAADHQVSVLIFPELSLTGYEPELAEALAIDVDDRRLDSLSQLALVHNMTIVAGAPVRSGTKRPWLSSIIFHPNGQRSCYAKMHLGSDEPTFFEPGTRPGIVEVSGVKIGIAICADSSKASHPAWYRASDCRVYAASVFLTEQWYAGDTPRLQSYAQQHEMLVVMANHGNSKGTLPSCGRSTLWLPNGHIGLTAEDTAPCLLIAQQTATDCSCTRIAL